jgi:hypothetical protein
VSALKLEAAGGREMVSTEFDSEVEMVMQELRGNLDAGVGLQRTMPGEELIRQTLSQFKDDLFITSRSWKRLPPVVSSRRGWKAQLELWFKRRLKRATNWYTWEQINFNAATNNALHSVGVIFTAYEKEQATLRAQVKELNLAIEELKINRQ